MRRALAALVVLAGCASAQPADSVWVMQRYALGTQCQPDGRADPPDVPALFAVYEVETQATAVVPMGVIAMCGAPSYVGEHYARLAARHLDVARRLGFAVSPPPPVGERLDLVWLGRRVTAGRQCSEAPFEPLPDARADLREVGVMVYEVVEQGQAVCRACGCPERSVRQVVRVDASSADAARALGFEYDAAATR